MISVRLGFSSPQLFVPTSVSNSHTRCDDVSWKLIFPRRTSPKGLMSLHWIMAKTAYSRTLSFSHCQYRYYWWLFFAEKTPNPCQLLVVTAMCCNNNVTRRNCTEVFPVLKFQSTILPKHLEKKMYFNYLFSNTLLELTYFSHQLWYLKETLTRVRFCHLLCRIKNANFCIFTCLTKCINMWLASHFRPI